MGSGKMIRTAAWVAAVSGLLAAPASAKDLVYKVRYELTHGSWMANWDCQCNHDNVGGFHTISLSDNHFTTHTLYLGLKIPRRGDPGSIKLQANSWDASGAWSVSGSYWTNTNPDSPINCTGKLTVAGGAPSLTSASGTNAKHLELYVQPGEKYVPSGATGTSCDNVDGNPAWAFWPISGPGLYVPDMLTAHILVSLHTLRSMHVGDVAGASFHEPHAKRLPPADCQAGGSGTGGSCSESLHWTGSVSFTRTR
jgi:hypothetical protein